MITYDELIKNISILIIDDDEDYLLVTHQFLKFKGYDVDKVSSATEALKRLKERNYQILLIDYFMPEMSGEDLINEIRKENKEVIIILQTGFSGQKPPIESMEKLNIQNYHDKTEGIDRLNLELISAVKIFNQQNEIALTKFKSVSIGNLISGIASEIKSSLLSISASIEYTNMLVSESKDNSVEIDDLQKINKFSNNNKMYLEKIDKVLTAIINQVDNSDRDDVLKDSDIMEVIELILKNELKVKNVLLEKRVILRAESYLIGQINDTIFVVCEFIRRICKLSEPSDKIELILTEDETNWYFNIKSDKINDLQKSEVYLLKCVVLSIKNASINVEDNLVQVAVKK